MPNVTVTLLKSTHKSGTPEFIIEVNGPEKQCYCTWSAVEAYKAAVRFGATPDQAENLVSAAITKVEA